MLLEIVEISNGDWFIDASRGRSLKNRRQCECIAIRVIMLILCQKQAADAWLVSRDISFS